MNNHEPNVAIFWDYENCTPSSAVPGYTIVNNIRRIAHEYGSVKFFKAYLELEHSSSGNTSRLRSELQSCGVSLTDCPHNGRKDVADKMMIVDMLTYAIDTPAPATLILISGDRDFVYAVSVLRWRKYRVILVVPNNAHHSLRSQASAVLDWEVDILGKTGKDHSQRQPLGEPELNSATAQNLGLHRRAQSSYTTAAAPSPGIQRAHRRMSFRETTVSLEGEFLRPAVNIDSASVQSTRSRTNSSADTKGGLVTAGRSVSTLPQSTPATPKRDIAVLPTPVDKSAASGHQDNGPIADLNMHLKNLEEPTSSDDSFYQSTSSNALRSNQAGPRSDHPLSDPDIQTAIPQLSVSGLFTGQSRGPARAIKPSSSPTSLSSPSPSKLHQVEELLNPTTHPLPKVHGQGTAPGGCQPPPKMTVEYRRGSLTVWSASEDSDENDVDTSPSRPEILNNSETFVDKPSEPSAAQWQVPSGKRPGPSVIQPVPSPVPPQFIPLVQVLETFRTQGLDKPTRSVVALELITHHRNAFNSAGVERWKEYAALAEKAGIITLGGIEAQAWVALAPARQNTLVAASALAADRSETKYVPTSQAPESVLLAGILPSTQDDMEGAGGVNASDDSRTSPNVALPMVVPDSMERDIRSVRSAPGTLPSTEEQRGLSDQLQIEQSSGADTMSMPVTPPQTIPRLVSRVEGAEYASLNAQPTIPQSSSSAVAPHFMNLLRVLRRFQATGSPQPLRSVVANTLMQESPETYRLAGVSCWREFAALAESLGFILLGGSQGLAWVSLAPRWVYWVVLRWSIHGVSLYSSRAC